MKIRFMSMNKSSKILKRLKADGRSLRVAGHSLTFILQQVKTPFRNLLSLSFAPWAEKKEILYWKKF
jgi:hypothetical protein